MRYIYLDAAKVPEDWRDKAKEINAELDAAADETERKAIIDANKAHWGDIKSKLLEMSQQKCWYSEADDCVSDWHVDHFRPKDHYQWLAFEWTNYRISGAKPNRKKSNKFPLFDEEKRASYANQNIGCEKCLLLDPTNPEDVSLITFDEQGIAKAAAAEDAECCRRVELSADRLDLNTERLISKRQSIWTECSNKIDQIRNCIAGGINVETALGSNAVKTLASDVQAAVAASAPFSMTALACVKTYRAEWILDIQTQ